MLRPLQLDLRPECKVQRGRPPSPGLDTPGTSASIPTHPPSLLPCWAPKARKCGWALPGPGLKRSPRLKCVSWGGGCRRPCLTPKARMSRGVRPGGSPAAPEHLLRILACALAWGLAGHRETPSHPSQVGHGVPGDLTRPLAEKPTCQSHLAQLGSALGAQRQRHGRCAGPSCRKTTPRTGKAWVLGPQGAVPGCS